MMLKGRELMHAVAVTQMNQQDEPQAKKVGAAWVVTRLQALSNIILSE